jgi:hypothetical protein
MKVEIKKSLDLLSKMEQNTFLLPDGFTEVVDMMFEEWSYKTYVGKRGAGRYIIFYIYKDDPNKEIYEIVFRGEEIQIKQSILEKSLTANKIYQFVEAIYKEKHSFEMFDDSLKTLRKDLRSKKQKKEAIEKEIQKLNQKIIDAKKLIQL